MPQCSKRSRSANSTLHQCRYVSPVQHGGFFFCFELYIPVINQCTCALFGEQTVAILNTPEHAGMKSICRLDFYQCFSVSLFNDEINFIACFFAPKVELMIPLYKSFASVVRQTQSFQTGCPLCDK